MNDELLFLVLSKTSELESELAAKNWDKALALDKERLNLLVRLAEGSNNEANSKGYQTLIRELLEGTHKRLSEANDELSRCRSQMLQFGQQRKASNLYHDTARAK